jgi:hypothetical protein
MRRWRQVVVESMDAGEGAGERSLRMVAAKGERSRDVRSSRDIGVRSFSSSLFLVEVLIASYARPSVDRNR